MSAKKQAVIIFRNFNILDILKTLIFVFEQVNMGRYDYLDYDNYE